MQQQATIEIRSRNVDYTKILGKVPGVGAPQHLYIIHKDSSGKETILRGGPESRHPTGMWTDDLKITKGGYEDGNPDYTDDRHTHPRIEIARGTDEQMQEYLDKMWKRAEEINAGNYDYKLPFGQVQNSNTAVKEMVGATDLNLELPLDSSGKPVNAPGTRNQDNFEHTPLDRKLKQLQENLGKLQQKIVGDKYGFMHDVEAPESFANFEDFFDYTQKIAASPSLKAYSDAVMQEAEKLESEHGDAMRAHTMNILNFAEKQAQEYHNLNQEEQADRFNRKLKEYDEMLQKEKEQLDKKKEIKSKCDKEFKYAEEIEQMFSNLDETTLANMKQVGMDKSMEFFKDAWQQQAEFFDKDDEIKGFFKDACEHQEEFAEMYGLNKDLRLEEAE